MTKPSLSARLRYRFDNFMSRGVIALVAGLFAVTMCMVLSAALILFLARLRPDAGTQPYRLSEAFWQVLMRSIDTGTVAGDSNWSFRIVGFLVTLGGIFIISALIGILASGLEQRLADLRRGRSLVIESGHTVILGWSPQVFTIISELAHANRNLPRNASRSPAGGGARSACVAILADQDKVEMEEQIRTKVPELIGTRIVCRSGDPLDPDDIKIVSPETARAILLLSPGGQYPDLPVVKSLLALSRERETRSQPYHIVTALQRPANLETVRMIGGEEVKVFLVDRLIAYTIAQTCRQPGLSVVYGELFSFEGAAVQFIEARALSGKTYREALHRLETACLMGVRHRDGEVSLNPPSESLIHPGDRLVVLAGSAESIRISPEGDYQVDRSAYSLGNPSPVALDRLLILGWNRRASLILEQLGSYMPAGSEVKVVAPYPVEKMQADCIGKEYFNLQLNFHQGNPVDRVTLEKLVSENYQYVVILTPTDVPEVQLADASTMLSVLHLRDITHKAGRTLAIVSEIMDVRNRDLTEVTSAEDVIISERLVALAMTQIAENKDALPLFADLLTPGGPEIYLKPVVEYVLPGLPVSFHTVIEAALRKNQTAIGYRLLSQANQKEHSFGVYLNPEKSSQVTFSEQDRVIVLAEG